jgi:hypothetical protein
LSHEENEMKDHYFNLKYLAGLLIYACALVSASTQAVPLNLGQTVPLSGTTAVLSPETAGPIIDEQIANFAIEVDGKMVTGAVSQRLRNFQGGSFLIDYRVTSFDDQGLGLQIEGLKTQPYFGVGLAGPLDVDYRLDEAGDIFPVTASLQDIGFGGPVEFDFGPNPLLAGETSRWMFVGDPNNDIVGFGSNPGADLLVLDPTGTQFNIRFDAYWTAIPIPGSILLMASGLIGLVGIAKRRVH